MSAESVSPQHLGSPVAPPPPPVLLNSHKQHNSNAVNINLIDECLWAVKQPELQKACFLARVCSTQPPKCCSFRDITSILQVGPTCGLTALSMIMGGEPTTVQLLDIAKQHHYTNNGEMFSAHYLWQLICDTLIPSELAKETLANIDENRNSRNAIECVMHEGRLNCAKVRECLLAGACLFVPYDPDFNHEPCLKYGHKAHWGLIIGYLISDKDKFYVLARHGKAKNLAVWSLEALSESNANLVEFTQPKGYPDCDFLLPPGGIAGDLGLCERAIIVKGLPNATNSIQ